MRAWLCKAYGSPEVLALEEVQRPSPGENEVLVRICTTSVSAADVRIRTMKLPRGFATIGRLVFGLWRPRNPILGSEFSGIVESTGSAVTAFKIGDAVIGFSDIGMRCHAEYRIMPADRALIPKPANLSFEQAACLMFGGTTALHYLRKARAGKDDRVLVLGASGAVGSAIVQLARHMGAHVTGVTSTPNLELVRLIGAHKVIDYTRDDFKASPSEGGTAQYDVIADTVGASSFSACKHVLAEHGRYLPIAGSLMDLLARPSGTKKSIGGPASSSPADVMHLATLAENGVFAPVIDSVYPFEKLNEAHARVETGRKRGNVVVTVSAP